MSSVHTLTARGIFPLGGEIRDSSRRLIICSVALTCKPEDCLDVRRLGTRVGFPILREARGQEALHVSELPRGLGMRPEIVAKSEILAPQRTALLNQVDVVRPRLPAAKELSSRNALLAAVVVTGPLESGDVVLERGIARTTRHDVENRFRTHTRDRGPADVFESQRHRATRGAYPLVFSGEQRWPPSVVLDEAHDSRLETKGLSHRYSVSPFRRTPSFARLSPTGVTGTSLRGAPR